MIRFLSVTEISEILVLKHCSLYNDYVFHINHNPFYTLTFFENLLIRMLRLHNGKNETNMLMPRDADLRMHFENGKPHYLEYLL